MWFAVAFEVGPFALLLLAVPVLLLGEQLCRRWVLLQRCNVPAAIVGGLLVAFALLAADRFWPGAVAVNGSTPAAVWLWPVLPQWDFAPVRATDVERPLLTLFFTCIGLNASWRLARQGGGPLLTFLGLAAAIGAVQAVSGAGLAAALGESPLLGVMASNVSLMGGFGTAAGFAPEFEKAGLPGAAALGIAAAALGVIAGGVVAGFVGGQLVERRLKRQRGASDVPAAVFAAPAGCEGTFLHELRGLANDPLRTVRQLVALLACMKLGSFVSQYIQSAGITFPVYMGAMLVAAALRNLHDARDGTWLDAARVDEIGSIALMWMLAVVMIDLQLAQLAHAAVPLLVIVTAQVVLLAALAYWIVFRLMGRDYEASVMSAGMIGFGLGATSNALATMRVLAVRYGPAPRAFLIVPIVGAFLIDFLNALLTTSALNVLK